MAFMYNNSYRRRAIRRKADINITTMQIGKREDSESAVVYLNIEGDMTDEVMDALRENISGLEELWYVTL